MSELHKSRALIPCSLSRAHGFTAVEIITTIVILGVLAFMAAPRFFDRTAFENRGFYDQVISTLRYAQKAAITQRRFVCVAFGANSVTLTMGATSACGTNLAGPAGLSPYSVASNSASFATPLPAAFYFDALGRPSVAQAITIIGYAIPITIEPETGYVH